jgi:hypothetical protein
MIDIVEIGIKHHSPNLNPFIKLPVFSSQLDANVHKSHIVIYEIFFTPLS